MNTLIKPYYPLNLFLFTASLSVCTILLGKLEWALLIFITLIAIPFINWRSFNPTEQFRWIFILFYIPFILSSCWSFLLIPIVNEPEYNDYIKSTYIFRILHVFLYFIVLVYACCIIKETNNREAKYFMQVFAWGVMVCLGIFGLWQILGGLFGIWVPTIETRGALYSARALGINRVTSITDEPSYLAPFLIDAILILFYLKKKGLAFFLAIILIFSISFGGLSEAIILIFFYLYFSSKKRIIQVIFIFLCIAVVLAYYFPEIVDLILLIVQSRNELQGDFDPSQNSRTAMIIYPIVKWSQGNVISLLLGYGPGSFKYMLAANPNEVLFTTSNNIYADLLYEEGLIGVICLIVLFMKLWIYFGSFKKEDMVLSRLFLIHIIMSSFYRADYASSRYTVLFIFILIFCQLFKPQKTTLSWKYSV